MSKENIIAHDQLETGVYLVIVFDSGHLDRHGIFTTLAKAQAWMEAFPPEVKCLCAPFVLDEPDYGSIPKKELQ